MVYRDTEKSSGYILAVQDMQKAHLALPFVLIGRTGGNLAECGMAKKYRRSNAANSSTLQTRACSFWNRPPWQPIQDFAGAIVHRPSPIDSSSLNIQYVPKWLAMA